MVPPHEDLPDARAHRDALKLHDSLSPRQIQVLELLLRGLDNPAIAQETGLALGSVKNCVSSIFLVYTAQSITQTFFITAASFGALSLWGYTTKRDLTGMAQGMWPTFPELSGSKGVRLSANR